MRPPLPKHHTVSDWDFESAWDTYWDLDTSIYRSSPSALRSKDAFLRRVVCNYAGTTNLPTGRVESWFYKRGSSYTRQIGFCCRLQYPTWANCYYVYQLVTDGAGDSYIYFYVGATLLKRVLIAEPPINTWFQRRLTWWTSGAWFILRFERWDGAAWQNDAGDVLDPTPSWGTGAVNRCGLAVQSHGTEDQVRIDDTIIYGP